MRMRSLAVTLTIAFLGVSILVLLLSGSMNIFELYQANNETVTRNQEIIAKDAINNVQNFLQEKKITLFSTINSVDISSVSEEEQKSFLNKILKLEKAFRQVSLLDSNGNELTRVSRLSTSDLGQLTKENIQEVFSNVKSKESYISQIYIDENTFEPMSIISTPINDKFGDFQGLALAELSLKYMWDLVGSIKVGENGTAYVVNKKGTLIAYNDTSRVIKGENLENLKKVNEFINSKDSNIKVEAEIVKGINGTDVVSTFVPLSSTNWAVIIEVPVFEAYKPVINSIVASLVVMIASIILAILVGILISRKITKPLIKLRNATQKISKGELDTKIDIKSKNEIGELSKNFNHMVTNVSQLIGKIKDTSNIILKESSNLSKSSIDSVKSADSIDLAISQIVAGSEEQAHEAEKTTEQSNKLGEGIDYVVKRAEAVEEITKHAKNLSTDSKDTIDSLMKKAEQTDNIIKIFSENTNSLVESIDKIKNITELINSITKKISLLALNASIEAAKAGEAGKGFSLIAKEMSNLVNQSRESAKMIGPILVEIQNQSDISLQTSNEAFVVVDEQMKAVYSAQDAFKEISLSMDNIVEKMSEMNTNIKSIVDVKEDTISSVCSISTVSQENAASSEEIKATSEVQKNIAYKVKRYADNLSIMGKNLIENINIFKTSK